MHQYFGTRASTTGTRSYEFSKFLLRRGHRVTMLTSGRDNVDGFNCRSGQGFVRFETDGIEVIAINAAYNNPHKGTGMNGAKRMLHFLDFARLAARVGRQLQRPDVVFATSTPLTIGLPGIRLARHFSVPFVFEVRDLWPDALINVGALKNPVVIWWLRRTERRLYHAADHLVALSPGMKEGIMRQGIPDERVTVIPNGSDLDLFRPDIDGSAERARLGLGDRFSAIYFGAMGRANGLDYVIEAARELQQRARDHIVFVLHGDGGMRPQLEELARRYELRNVVFSNLVPDKAAVARIVAGCNACMTIYAATDKEQTWSPNKMFDALAAGKPVLINVPGWLGETIQENRAGRSLDPQRPAALAETVEELAARPGLCAEMGRNARNLAEAQFSREALAARLEEVLRSTIDRS